MGGTSWAGMSRVGNVPGEDVDEGDATVVGGSVVDGIVRDVEVAVGTVAAGTEVRLTGGIVVAEEVVVKTFSDRDGRFAFDPDTIAESTIATASARRDHAQHPPPVLAVEPTLQAVDEFVAVTEVPTRSLHQSL